MGLGREAHGKGSQLGADEVGKENSGQGSSGLINHIRVAQASGILSWDLGSGRLEYGGSDQGTSFYQIVIDVARVDEALAWKAWIIIRFEDPRSDMSD